MIAAGAAYSSDKVIVTQGTILQRAKAGIIKKSNSKKIIFLMLAKYAA